MCILKIHAQSHTANAIQSAAHNMDTTLSDLGTLAKLLDQRGHKVEAMAIRLAQYHVNKQTDKVWDVWREFITESPAVDVAPIGYEAVQHSDIRPSTFVLRPNPPVPAFKVDAAGYPLSPLKGSD